jgi:GNAT superfamily N-acetyltransferase
VYAGTREEELAVVAWDDADKNAFLRMQFEAQDRWYREQMPDASFDVVLVEDEPAGRLYVDRREGEIRIVDIALLPEYRNRGIGRRLLGHLIAEADRVGKPLTIHVERFNRARRFYERLGFREIADRGVYLLLERPGASR